MGGGGGEGAGGGEVADRIQNSVSRFWPSGKALLDW